MKNISKDICIKDEKCNKVTVQETETSGALPIETRYRPLGGNGTVTLLEVELITGRTHQIRAHLAGTGHPLIGDYKYGRRTLNDEYCRKYGLKSQLLHAYRLEIPEIEGVFPICLAKSSRLLCLICFKKS